MGFCEIENFGQFFIFPKFWSLFPKLTLLSFFHFLTFWSLLIFSPFFAFFVHSSVVEVLSVGGEGFLSRGRGVYQSGGIRERDRDKGASRVLSVGWGHCQLGGVRERTMKM